LAYLSFVCKNQFNKIKTFLFVFLAILMVTNSLVCQGQNNKSAPIKVGAAKVDITPSADKLPANYEGILDRIYSMAIVIDNGISSATLVTVDIGMMSDQAWKNITQRVEKELGIPVKNVMLTATHSHSVPFNLGKDFENNVFTSNAKIYGDQKIITCPWRKRTNTGRAGYAGTYEDADSVKIRLGLLLINDVAFTAVNGEVFNLIAQRLKKESPYARTLMATVTNGSANSGYIPNDAAFGYQTFEVLSSRLKPGFAESGIVNGILDMMQKAKY